MGGIGRHQFTHPEPALRRGDGFQLHGLAAARRMLRALEMLAAGRPITAIALDLGYSTASAFIGLFRRTFGETPATYRARL